MSPTRRLLLLLTIATLVVWLGLAVAAYPRLPDTIATHFGPTGVADRFTERSLMSWYGLPTVGVATTLLLLGVAQLAHSRPDLYNVPAKTALLALPPLAREPLLESLALFMTALAASMVLLFAAIHYDIWRAAMGGQQTLGMASIVAIIVTIGGSLVGTPLWMWWFGRRVREASASQHHR